MLIIIPASRTTLDVFNLFQLSGSGDNVAPDYRYALSIKTAMRVSTEQGNWF
jgi:hypothetical protein